MNFRPRLNKFEYDLVRGGGKRILVVGDLHEPFCLDGYRDFCIGLYQKYNCNEVVFIGDLLDNHFASFYDVDPDGHSAGEELTRAKRNIAKWYKSFPVAKVTTGNHDFIPDRRAFNAGLSKNWIKSISEVLETPGWDYAEEFIIDGNKYCHGTNRKARSRAKDDLISVIQGHYHSEGHITFYVGDNYRIFSMQVGCGLDNKTYAAAYGTAFKKQHINAGIVLDNGNLPILEYMKL